MLKQWRPRLAVPHPGHDRLEGFVLPTSEQGTRGRILRLEDQLKSARRILEAAGRARDVNARTRAQEKVADTQKRLVRAREALRREREGKVPA